MRSYNVVKQVVIATDEGKSAVHHRPGAVIDLDEDAAAGLVAAGRLAPVATEGPADPDPDPEPKARSRRV